jgi:hypothetical protein
MNLNHLRAELNQQGRCSNCLRFIAVPKPTAVTTPMIYVCQNCFFSMLSESRRDEITKVKNG